MNDVNRTNSGPQEVVQFLRSAAERLPKLSGHLVSLRYRDESWIPYEKWAAGYVTDLEGFCSIAADTIERQRAFLRLVADQQHDLIEKAAAEFRATFDSEEELDEWVRSMTT